MALTDKQQRFVAECLADLNRVRYAQRYGVLSLGVQRLGAGSGEGASLPTRNDR